MHHRGDTQPVVIRLADGEEGLVTDLNGLPVVVQSGTITGVITGNVTTLAGSVVTLTGTNIVVIEREREVTNITISNGASESEEIDGTTKAGGHVYVPNPWTNANIGLKKSATSGGTFDWVRDKSGALLQIENIQTAEAGWYQIPDEMFGPGYFKVVSCNVDGSGAALNQGGDRALAVDLYS